MEKNLSICGVDLCLKVVFLVSKPYLCGRWKKKQKGAGKKKKPENKKVRVFVSGLEPKINVCWKFPAEENQTFQERGCRGGSEGQWRCLGQAGSLWHMENSHLGYSQLKWCKTIKRWLGRGGWGLELSLRQLHFPSACSAVLERLSFNCASPLLSSRARINTCMRRTGLTNWLDHSILLWLHFTVTEEEMPDVVAGHSRNSRPVQEPPDEQQSNS